MVHAYIPIQTVLGAGQTPTLLKDDKQGLLFSGKFNFVKVCLGIKKIKASDHKRQVSSLSQRKIS